MPDSLATSNATRIRNQRVRFRRPPTGAYLSKNCPRLYGTFQSLTVGGYIRETSGRLTGETRMSRRPLTYVLATHAGGPVASCAGPTETDLPLRLIAAPNDPDPRVR